MTKMNNDTSYVQVVFLQHRKALWNYAHQDMNAEQNIILKQ